MYEPYFLAAILAAAFIIHQLISLTDNLSPHRRETYRAHCLLYLMEYYPGSTNNSQCDAIRFKHIGGGQVEVDIEIRGEITCSHVAFVLQVNDYDSGDLYVKKVDDAQISEFKDQTCNAL